MDDWWKEFESPVIPHTSAFVEGIKRHNQLKHINKEYNKSYPSSIRNKVKVRFDVVNVVFYYIRS